VPSPQQKHPGIAKQDAVQLTILCHPNAARCTPSATKANVDRPTKCEKALLSAPKLDTPNVSMREYEERYSR
jgi:hypothetical protein